MRVKVVCILGKEFWVTCEGSKGTTTVKTEDSSHLLYIEVQVREICIFNAVFLYNTVGFIRCQPCPVYRPSPPPCCNQSLFRRAGCFVSNVRAR
jgi:hypothetical protein